MRGQREKIDGRFEREVRWILSHAFTTDKFFTMSECAKYKPSEDHEIWRQNVGERPEVVEIYYKGEWICDVRSDMTRDQMINKVWRIIQLKVAAKKKKESEKNAHPSNTATQ